MFYLQLAELKKERSNLAERLRTAEKTSALQQQELKRQLETVEQNVQLRERDLMHVHQQYQILYQQFILLQQRTASQMVGFCKIYVCNMLAEIHRIFSSFAGGFVRCNFKLVIYFVRPFGKFLSFVVGVGHFTCKMAIPFVQLAVLQHMKVIKHHSGIL